MQEDIDGRPFFPLQESKCRATHTLILSLKRRPRDGCHDDLRCGAPHSPPQCPGGLLLSVSLPRWRCDPPVTRRDRAAEIKTPPSLHSGFCSRTSSARGKQELHSRLLMLISNHTVSQQQCVPSDTTVSKTSAWRTSRNPPANRAASRSNRAMLGSAAATCKSSGASFSHPVLPV